MSYKTSSTRLRSSSLSNFLISEKGSSGRIFFHRLRRFSAIFVWRVNILPTVITARGSRCGGAGWLLSHAAAWRLLPPSPPRIALARSAAPAPSTSRELTSRSIETDGSPASILAMRDWLERRRLASSTCDTPCRCRRSRRLRLKDSFISMSVASASDRPRNSCTDPTAHPAALSFSRLLFFIPSLSYARQLVVVAQPAFAGLQDRPGRLPSLFAEDLQDDDGIKIGPVYDTERGGHIVDAQFMAPRPDGWHRP